MGKIDILLSQFFSAVYNYLTLEYKPKFAKIFIRENHYKSMIKIIVQYYLGGNNVPDTARAIVDHIKQNKLT